jgi:hypothetical protein
MVTGITERNQMKTELANLGYSLKYIDDWQPKTTLYRHRPAYNDEGEVTDAIGTAVRNVPGNPDYVLRKARIGLFPWMPDEKCECRWCVAAGSEQVEEPATSFTSSSATVVESVPGPVSTSGTQDGRSRPAQIQCVVCDYVAEGASLSGAQSKLRGHAKSH